MTTYVIADMHGRDDLFDAALLLLGQRAPGRLIVLGDFIDRGPGSARLVEMLSGGPPADWRWTVLLGNHEAMMLEVLGGRFDALDWWVGNGGGATLASYGYGPGDPIEPIKVPARHLLWLAALPLVTSDAHRIYVHAGVNPDVELARQKREELIWKRYPRDDTRGLGDRHVVHGHTQSPRHPLHLAGRTHRDTVGDCLRLSP
jgi:serine/threonine protein phosphatase 1